MPAKWVYPVWVDFGEFLLACLTCSFHVCAHFFKILGEIHFSYNSKSVFLDVSENQYLNNNSELLTFQPSLEYSGQPSM